MQAHPSIPKREIKDIFTGAEARKIVLDGVKKGYEAVSSTYGPAANNVLQGMPFGDPVLTRDGVTVAKRIVLPWKPHDDAWSVMRQASETTNKSAGDGTTATIVLGYSLLKEANKLVAAGENAMVLKRQLDKDSKLIIEWVKLQSQPAKGHLLEVASVSSGDPNIGALISDTMEEIGLDAGITIREQNYPTVNVEKINGYYFSKGWNVLNSEVSWDKPLILVAQKRIAANTDVIPLIQWVLDNSPTNPKLVIIGDVSGEALQTLLQNTMAQVDANGRPHPFEALVIPPPSYGDDAKLFCEDISIYVGGNVLTEAMNVKDLKEEDFGSADRVQLNNERGIVFKGSGEPKLIANRAAEIKTNMDKEDNAHAKDQYEQRYSKLVGKVAIVNVGGSTQAEGEELKFRVEDAIEATKSAMADGVIPGGGISLVQATGLDISPLFKLALRQTFNKLMENAAEDGGYRFKQISAAKFGFGFNLRDITDEPIDLTKAGIWDATRAVTQTIENATSSAGALLTVDTIITQIEDETPSPDS